MSDKPLPGVLPKTLTAWQEEYVVKRERESPKPVSRRGLAANVSSRWLIARGPSRRPFPCLPRYHPRA